MIKYNYIVDLSYIIFYSGFSTFKKYVDDFDIPQSKQTPDFDPTSDEEFNYLLSENIKYNIITPAQSVFPLINKKDFILCSDCSRKNIWRRDIYPDYKLNRDTKDHSKDKFNINKIFEYANNVIIPSIVDEFDCIKLSCGCAEGDDIIAVLSKYILNKNENNKIVIISSDRDMLQLCDSDRLTLITASGLIREPKKDMEILLKQKIDNDITANDFLLFKILLGDKSDNIPNVKVGLGPKKAFKLLLDKDALKSLLKEDISIAKSFQRNKQLISMSEIPNDVSDMIIEEYENIKQIKNVI